MDLNKHKCADNKSQRGDDRAARHLFLEILCSASFVPNDTSI